MVAEPAAIPLTCGSEAGEVAPPAISTLDVTVTLEVSLLLRPTDKPPAGAGADKVSGSAADCPGVRFTLPETVIEGCGVFTVTLTDAVAFERPAAVAVIVADPDPI